MDETVLLILADRSPALRFLVHRDLIGIDDETDSTLVDWTDRARREFEELKKLRPTDPLITTLCGSNEVQSRPVKRTIVELRRLGYLGFDRRHARVRDRAEFLFSLQNDDGSWPLDRFTSGRSGKPPQKRGRAHNREESAGEESREGYSMIPLQTALPLYGLGACGYAEDERCEKAYDRLIEYRLDDGAWPTGVASGVYGGVAGYRRLAHSRWGCRSNTTGAVIALSLHPSRRSSSEARRAMELLLGSVTLERDSVGFELARTLGVEPPRGMFTYFGKLDPVMLLDLCAKTGVSEEEERVGRIVDYIRSIRKKTDSGFIRFIRRFPDGLPSTFCAQLLRLQPARVGPKKSRQRRSGNTLLLADAGSRALHSVSQPSSDTSFSNRSRSITFYERNVSAILEKRTEGHRPRSGFLEPGRSSRRLLGGLNPGEEACSHRCVAFG